VNQDISLETSLIHAVAEANDDQARAVADLHIADIQSLKK
jgi:hypothetical protein